MAKYEYTAIFTKETSGYSVIFPALESCYTSGTDLPQALVMAKDVLCLTLYELEERGVTVPYNIPPQEIATDGESFASLVDCNTMAHRQYLRSTAVKKH